MSIRGKFPEQRPTLNLDFANSKKLDPRITFTRTTIGTRVSEENVLETISADDPRFDHDPTTGESLGLLIEELRTNDIRNSTMQGAASGTPGTAPTYWSMGTSFSGLTREISAVGEENGIPYIDVRFHGVATGNPFTYVPFWPNGYETNNSPATRTSRYTFSSYVKHISGTVPSGCTFILVITNVNASLGDLGEYKVSTIISSSSTPSGDLIANRFALTNTNFTSTDTAYFEPYYQWNVPYNTSFDVTIRIGLPQMEEGSFATSAIPTTDQGKTRNPDSVSMTGTNFSDWYNQSEGTIYCSGNNTGITTTTSRFYYAIEDTSNSSGDFIRQWIWNGNTGLLLNSFYTSNTTGQGSVISAEFGNTLTTDNKKTAVGYAKSDFASYYNGTSLNTDTSGNLPVGIDRLRIGTNLSGHISQLAYYPKRLTNTQLQNLTK